MRRAVKVAVSLGVTLALALVISFLMISPARAPSGGKLWTGGRTIASLQEEDFDKRLLKLQLCYGIRIDTEQCTLERRRVCKALVAHEMEAALEAPGAYLRIPIDFRCDDTAVGKPIGMEDDAVSLRPNGELDAIQSALRSALLQNGSGDSRHGEARSACEFLTDCKWATRPQTFSIRKLTSCAVTPNAVHRRILLNEVGAMVFGGKGGRRTTLYPALVEASGK